MGSPWRLLAPWLLISAATLPPAQGAPSPPHWSEGTPALLQQGLRHREGLTKGDALVALARQALGRPYSAFSLDQEPNERLRLDLTRFDCFLFVEQLLALVQLDPQRPADQAFVPTGGLEKALPHLKNGDIFGLVTRLKGLDVTHVGVVEVEGGRRHALHAAPGRGVMRSRDLARYVAGVHDVVGLMVLRPTP